MALTVLTYAFCALVLIIPIVFYVRGLKRREIEARKAADEGRLFSEGPRSQHPHIDANACIGCQTCTSLLSWLILYNCFFAPAYLVENDVSSGLPDECLGFVIPVRKPCVDGALQFID